jgi:cobalt-precorrin-5B (C1)-methyltransferase
MAETGYTLPVFAVAAAKAALLHLLTPGPAVASVSLDLLTDDRWSTTGQRPTAGDPPAEPTTIPIQQLARLDDHSALAITLSDPGDNLDLTRNTPIWAKVTITDRRIANRRAGDQRTGDRSHEPLVLVGGEGLGRQASNDEPAIYRYAQRLFEANLLPLIPADRSITVTLILPEGKRLAARTSNAAFGVLEGLSLLGTSGISQPLSAEAHLGQLRQQLQAKAKASQHLVFCIGSNGMQVAGRLGIADSKIVQTGNWVGAMLVEAGLLGVQSVLLLGYQGKLIKLAGGIFNTSSHLADAKLEIIAAALARQNGELSLIQAILAAPSADAAYQILVAAELAQPVFAQLAAQVTQKAQGYVQKYADVAMAIETGLFDRQGIMITPIGDLTPWH